MKSTPTTGMSIALATLQAASTSRGWTMPVTSWMEPPVCRFAVLRTSTFLPASGTDVQGEAGGGQAALGFGIDGNAALALGRRLAAARLALDQRTQVVLAVADHHRRTADRRGGELVADDHQAQVFAGEAGLEQHAVRDRARILDGLLDLLQVHQADGDAAPLLAARRFDDDAAVPGDEGFDLVVPAGRIDLLRNLHAGLAAPRRRVTALSSQMDTATPEVSSDRLSRQWIERPPCDSRKKPPAPSVTSTPMPRRRASSMMIRAYGLSAS